MISLPRLLSRRDSERSAPGLVAGSPRKIAVAGRELPLAVRRLRHARRITLRLAPDGSEVRVSMPEWGRTSDAVRFAEQRRDWLAVQLSRIPQPLRIEPGCMIPYRGQSVRIEWLETEPRRPLLNDGAVVLGGPRPGIETRLQRWLESEALRLAGDDLSHYCARAEHALPKLALSRAQRRWGSCASNGMIRINWRLIMAPDFVRRSVVAHEVAHMTHFDHSPAFHAHLDALYEAPIAHANSWLRQHGRTLYRQFA